MSNPKPFLRTGFWGAAVLLMILIFSFSAQPAEKSAASSGPLTDLCVALFRRDYDTLSPDQQFAVREEIGFYVRKAAHLSIYAALGTLFSLALGVDLSPRRALLFGLVLTALYAVSDEIHQGFVPGRSPELRDVLIDSAGGALGAGIVLWLRSALPGGKPNHPKKNKSQ